MEEYLAPNKSHSLKSVHAVSIAWNYAIASPDKVKQLILLDASGYPKKDEKGSLGFKLPATIHWVTFNFNKNSSMN